MFWTLIDALVLGLVVLLLYVFVLRPIVRNVPVLKQFFAEADTVWEKVWAVAWKSAVVFWSYVLVIFGFIGTQIDTVAKVFGDPNFSAQMSSFLSVNTKTLSFVMIGAAIVTFAARMRSVGK